MSGYGRPEENTLGVIVGRRPGRGRSRGEGNRPASRAVVEATAQGASLGSAYLGLGGAVLCAIGAASGLLRFFGDLDQYPSILPAALSWVLFVVAFLAVGIAVAMRGEDLPLWLFVVYLVALAGVVALDLSAIWPLHDIGLYATSSVAAGLGLLPTATLRPAREVFAAAVVLGGVFITAILVSTPITPSSSAAQVAVVAAATAPALFGLYVVRQFRRMVQLELDRVLVQSTVSAPRFAVGMLASEELARLDLAAEELLDGVADGLTPLPLEPKTASRAATLATELRLHLIEGRRETWLYHAITESEQLGKSTTLNDPGSLAGLLDPQQRDGLLSAIWLLVADRKKTTSTVRAVLGPVLAPTNSLARRTITIPIVITTTGVARNRVDPSTWAALGRVGTYSASAEDGSLRVDIQCVVANPAGK